MVRIVSGVTLAAIFFSLIWFTNATVLLIVALAVAAIGVHEYVQIFRVLGATVPALPTLLTTWAVTIAAPFQAVAIAPILAIGLIVVAIWTMTGIARQAGREFPDAARGIAAAVLAPVYLGVGLGSLVAVYVWGGREAVLLVMATIVVSDSAQYFTGRALGRNPLAVRLSPKKTIEGALGGFLFGTAFFVAGSSYLLPAGNSVATYAALGVALVAAGIAGDLFESTLKRAAGVKDSSSLIPGHGGVLDRIDALLFAAPVFSVYARYLFA